MVVVGGLLAFGVMFALNSAVHSYLILAYTDGEKAAMNVGFYYTANAMVNTRSNPWHVRPSPEIKTRSLLVVLHRWAGIVGIRAEDAAVTRLWTQGSSTTGTLIDNDSRISWYGRCLCLMAIWAVDAGDAFHDSSLTARLLSMEIIHVAST